MFSALNNPDWLSNVSNVFVFAIDEQDMAFWHIQQEFLSGTDEGISG